MDSTEKKYKSVTKLIDWFIEKLKTWGDGKKGIVLFPANRYSQLLLNINKSDPLLSISYVADFCPEDINRQSCDCDIIELSQIEENHTVLIVSPKDENHLRKKLGSLIRSKKIYRLFGDILDPLNEIRYVSKLKRGNSKINYLISDLRNWDGFVSDHLCMSSKKNYAELEPILEKSQIYEIINKTYICRCFNCSAVNRFSFIQVDDFIFYIFFKCEKCGKSWLRIHFYRNYNKLFIFIPEENLLVFAHRFFHKKSFKNELDQHVEKYSLSKDFAVKCVHNLSKMFKNALLNIFEEKRSTPSQIGLMKDNCLNIISNRLGSVFHAFLDEGVILWHLNKTEFLKGNCVNLFTAEFAQETSDFICTSSNVKKFRGVHDTYSDGLYKLNTFLLANQRIFFFSPVMKKVDSNILYNFNDAMRKDWFDCLNKEADLLKNNYDRYFPIIFIYVRPFQERVWYPQEDNMLKLIELCSQKYPDFAIVLHGNSTRDNFFDDEGKWQEILKHDRVINCIDKSFSEQYILNRIADVGLFISGGGLTIPILSGSPFIQMINYQLYESHILDLRKRLQYWITDDSVTANRNRYVPLIDVDYNKEMNVLFEPEYVLNAISFLLRNIRKQKYV